MGTWLEQLIAESSGKNNKGVTPVISNLPDSGSMIEIFLENGKSSDVNEKLITIKVNKENIFEDMFIWQISTLMLCKEINVFPFDEPDVKSSKLNTLNILQSKKNISALDMPFANQNISEIFNNNSKKEILYLNLFTEESDHMKNSLKVFKKYLRLFKKINCISSFGPRYLHSIGQLQKGGPKKIWTSKKLLWMLKKLLRVISKMLWTSKISLGRPKKCFWTSKKFWTSKNLLERPKNV